MAYSNKKSTKVGSNIFANEATANVDYKYGPYTSIDEAYATLGEDGYDVIAIGLTFGIITDNGIEEYWFATGITKDDITQKGGGSALLSRISALEERLAQQEQVNETQQGVIDNVEDLQDVDFAEQGDIDALFPQDTEVISPDL